MSNCKHNSYKDHHTFWGAFCKGNSERWYPCCVVAFLAIVLLFVIGLIGLIMWLV